MTSVPTPTSPHLYPRQQQQQQAPPSSSRSGRADEALKKLLPSWSRSRATTPDPSAPLERAQSQLDWCASSSMESMYGTMADSNLRSSSRASRQYPAEERGDRPPTLARTLIHKSSRLLLQKRKSTTKLRSPTTSAWDDDDEPSTFHISSLLSKATPPPPLPVIRKEAISDPFNFQHLTHTSRSHAQILQNASGSALVTEFCAHRMGQKPRGELKGIKAEAIPAGIQSEVVSLASPNTTAYPSPTASRPTTPRPERMLRPSQSVDNFRPAINRLYSAPLAPLVPPPRLSSRKPVNLANVLVDVKRGPALDSPTLPTPATASTARSPDSQWSATNVSTPATEASGSYSPVEIAQAVTTPDDTARELAPHSKQGSCTTLANLPEEEETAVKRQSERSSTQSIRHIRSMPTVKHFSRAFTNFNWPSSQSSPKSDSSESDPTLPSPGRAPEEVPSGPLRRFSMQPKALHESWEDSVDYCYHFAMDENTVDEDALTMDGAQEDTPTGATTPAMTKSANSSSVSVSGMALPTPSSGLEDLQRDAHGSGYGLSPSLLAPKEYSTRVTHEEVYGQKLVDTDPKAPYTFFFPQLEDWPQHYSPRSSRSGSSRRAALSKSSSQDSFASRAAGSSGAATPALVRSKSRDQLSLAADVAALTKAGTTITDAIDSMRQDLIRAAEEMPDAHFAATIAPTLTPPPSRLALRGCPSPEMADGPFARPTAAPRFVASGATPPQRSRASSAAHPPPTRTLGHRTSYSVLSASVARN